MLGKFVKIAGMHIDVGERLLKIAKRVEWAEPNRQEDLILS